MCLALGIDQARVGLGRADGSLASRTRRPVVPVAGWASGAVIGKPPEPLATAILGEFRGFWPVYAPIRSGLVGEDEVNLGTARGSADKCCDWGGLANPEPHRPTRP